MIARLRSRLAASLGSIAGRSVLILAVGLTLAVAASLMIAEQIRLRDLDQLRRAGLVATIATAINGLRERPAEFERALRNDQIVGIHASRALAVAGVRDAEAERLLALRIGAAALPRVERLRAPQCSPARGDAGGRSDLPPPDCWSIRFTASDGTPRTLIADLPLIHVYRSAFLDPLFIALLGAIGVVLALLVSRSTIAPLQHLTHAARQFSVSADPVDLPEKGPSEVRTALRTFNLMQQRVRDGVRERTHILAAVSHDLQTPLTRMRLRVERLPDAALRANLIEDLAMMQRLVGEGLDLARSTEQHEPWSIVDIDSLLSSLADDMTDLGARVDLVARSGARTSVRLAALTRAIQNLVDNAVRYGGSGEIGSEVRTDTVVIEVRDHGPGIAESDLMAAFEPFTRLASGRSDGQGGTGLGLTIARAQAATFGGTVGLANHPEGGLVATLCLPIKVDT